MAIFLKALLFVVVAEMGDKTQLLAMALAGKYKAKDVMIGVFIATVFNHGIAVAAGSYLSEIVPMKYVQMVAAVLFIIFGLWTIRGDEIDKEKDKKKKFGPILTVAIAFFIAEFGDKTQLMTITLAAQYKQPIFILMGTTIGMLIADGIGIIGGCFIAKHVSPNYIKWGAAFIFIIFGVLGLYESVPMQYLKSTYIIPFVLVLIVSIVFIGIRNKDKMNPYDIQCRRKS